MGKVLRGEGGGKVAREEEAAARCPSLRYGGWRKVLSLLRYGNGS